MNPLTNVKNINKLNETELSKGLVDKKSWHDIYKESAWVFIGGLPYDLTEGDVLSVFSQYGEIVNINLVRDKKTGKTKGFCFLCYANQKSTVLAVDNLNGIKLVGRTIRVDHVANYKPPKDNENDDEIAKQLKAEGCAPRRIKVEPSNDVTKESKVKIKKKKIKKEKKKHKKKKTRGGEPDRHISKKMKIKEEKIDPGYAKYELPQTSAHNMQKKKSSKAESSDSESSSDVSTASSSHQPSTITKNHEKSDYGKKKKPVLSKKYDQSKSAKLEKTSPRKMCAETESSSHSSDESGTVKRNLNRPKFSITHDRTSNKNTHNTKQYYDSSDENISSHHHEFKLGNPKDRIHNKTESSYNKCRYSEKKRKRHDSDSSNTISNQRHSDTSNKYERSNERFNEDRGHSSSHSQIDGSKSHRKDNKKQKHEHSGYKENTSRQNRDFNDR